MPAFQGSLYLILRYPSLGFHREDREPGLAVLVAPATAGRCLHEHRFNKLVGLIDVVACRVDALIFLPSRSFVMSASKRLYAINLGRCGRIGAGW